MAIVIPTAEALTDPACLRAYFSDHEVVHVPNYNGLATASLDDLNTEGQLRPLSTDGGGVYDLYEGVIPPRFVAIADSLGKFVGAAAGVAVNAVDPSVHEIVSYRDGASLSMHRDSEGKSVTKIILTLAGKGSFCHDADQFDVSAGSLVIMRGREFLDVPTPYHGTKQNIGRTMLLAEPNYL